MNGPQTLAVKYGAMKGEESERRRGQLPSLCLKWVNYFSLADRICSSNQRASSNDTSDKNRCRPNVITASTCAGYAVKHGMGREDENQVRIGRGSYRLDGNEKERRRG
jgi:hypothetical protein